MLREAPFYFLRHGETDWNLQKVVQGQIDVPLNATGLAQARSARDLMRHIEICTICSSPLDRALHTAKIVNETADRPIEVIDGLKEVGFGRAEGQAGGSWFADWKRGAANPEGAETYSSFVRRALDAVNEALTRPGPVLIVSHGGVYWAVQRYARLDSEFDIPNGVPVHHVPPCPDAPWWDSTVVTA